MVQRGHRLLDRVEASQSLKTGWWCERNAHQGLGSTLHVQCLARLDLGQGPATGRAGVKGCEAAALRCCPSFHYRHRHRFLCSHVWDPNAPQPVTSQVSNVLMPPWT